MRVNSLIILRLWFCLSVLGAASGMLHAQPLQLMAGSSMQSLSETTQFWADTASNADLSTVRAGVPWQAAPNNGMNFGFVSHPVWLYAQVSNVGNDPSRRYLVVDGPVVDHLEVFVVNQGHLADQYHIGNALPYSERLIDSRKFIVPLEFAAQQTLDIYIRVRERGSMQVPLQLWQPEAFYQQYQYEQARYAAYFGVLICLILYNFCLLVSVRTDAYFYYICYISSVLVLQASQTGFGAQYLWPQHPQLSDFLVGLSINMTMIAGGLFTHRTLDLRRGTLAYGIVVALIMIACLMIVGALILPMQMHLKLSALNAMISAAAFWVAGVSRWREGNEAARIYTLAWGALLLGAAIYGVTKLGWLPLNGFTNNIFLIGSAVEGVLLSFSLAARIRDITDHRQRLMRVRLENEMEQLKLRNMAATANAASDAKSEFIATISHEIRTPINGILGAADLLDHTALDKTQSEYLQIVRHSGAALLDLINNVLDYSRIEAGKLDLDQHPFELSALSQSLQFMFTPHRQSAGLEFDVSVAPGAPDRVIGDLIRVRQVLINLISNAFKFTEAGGVRVVIKAEQRWLRFDVIDTGVGISVDQQANLFARFQQMDNSTTRRFGGAGLGLWISKRLVEMMDGEIGVKSEPGAGSCFWFRVPLVQMPLSDEDDAGNHTDGGMHRPLLGMTVLVAEDNDVNRVLLERSLQKLGATVLCAENGRQALISYQRHYQSIDIVLLDYEMPEMDGHAATCAIRDFEAAQELPRVRIVGLSAHSLPDSIKQLLQAGMDAYITKPASQSVLMQAILTS